MCILKCWRSTKTHQEDHIHHWPQLGEQLTCVHQELQKTRGGIKKPFATFTRLRIYPIFYFLPQVLHVQGAKGWWLVKLRQQGQSARTSTCLFGCTHGKQRHCHDLAREFADIVRIFDYHLGNDVNKGAYHGLCDDMFGAQDIDVQEGAPMWGWCHGGTRKQRRQLVPTPRHKVVILLKQTGPYCIFLLQNKKQGAHKWEKCE